MKKTVSMPVDNKIEGTQKKKDARELMIVMSAA
jgi:hypothetical protein